MAFEQKIMIVIDSTGAVKNVKDLDKNLNKLDKTVDKNKSAFGGLSKAITATNLTMAAGTALVIKTLSASIQTTKKFETAVSDLSAITGATGDDLKFLADASREFGKSTTLSATEAATAFKLIASAKPDLLDSVEALKMVTKEAITLAEAAGSTLPEAADLLGSSLNQFGAEADQASRFINVMAAGSKFGAASIADMAMSLKDSGTTAASANISFEETNAALQQLSTVAIKGSQAGTSLRNVILKLQKEGVDKLNPAVVGLSGALKNLNAENRSNTELMKLFGLENVNAAKALLGKADSLDTLTQKLTATNTAYEQARIKTDNLEGDQKKLNSALEETQLIIGSRLTPSMRDMVQGLTEIVNSVPNVMTEFQLFGQFLMNDIAVSFVEFEYIFKAMWEGMKGATLIAVAAILTPAREMALGLSELLAYVPGADEMSKNLALGAGVITSVSGATDNLTVSLEKLNKEKEYQIELLNKTSYAILEEITAENKLIDLKSSSKAAQNNATPLLSGITERSSGSTKSKPLKETVAELDEMDRAMDLIIQQFDRLDAESAKSFAGLQKNAKKTTEDVAQISMDLTSANEGLISGLLKNDENAFEAYKNKMIDSFSNMLIDMATKALMNPISLNITGGAASAPTSGGGGSDFIGDFFSGIFGKAGGGFASAGGMYEVNERRPEMLTVGNRDYLMMGGQNGNITPNINSGGGSQKTTVNVYNSTGATAKTTESTDSNGNTNIDVMIEEKINASIQNGALDKQMGSIYNIKRRGN